MGMSREEVQGIFDRRSMLYYDVFDGITNFTKKNEVVDGSYSWRDPMNKWWSDGNTAVAVVEGGGKVVKKELWVRDPWVVHRLRRWLYLAKVIVTE